MRVYNSDATLLTDGTPYGPTFTGGIFVAAGDVNGDGLADVITAPASGSSLVRVFNGIGPSTLYEIPAYAAAFTGGVTVAAADLNGDGHAEIITGTGSGSPIVQVFSGGDGALIGGVFAFEPTFLGGVFVAASSPSGIRFTSAATTTFATGTAGSFTVTTSAVPSVTSITMAGTLPTGITFTDLGDGTATLAGTAAPGTGGTHTVTFTASNGADAPVAQTFTLRLEGPPQITSTNATTFSVGGAGTFTVTTSGFPAPALTSSGALPAGVTFTDNGDGTAALSGTPLAGGSYPLTFTANNGVGSAATQAFALTVDASPAFTSAATTTFVVGTTSTFAITATAEPPITTITSSGTLPTGVTFMDNGGGSATLTGTPGLGAGGAYPLTLTASNGVGPDATQTFALTINEAPIITSGSTATFTLGSPGTFTVASTGFPTPTLSSTGTVPAGVTFVAHADGTATLAGTATAGGSFPLTITATNGVGVPVMQSFTLTVEQAPAIVSANATSFLIDAAGTFQVIATGFPVPSIARGGDTLPASVTFTDHGDSTATLAGVPDPGTGGTYNLTFQATSAAGSSPIQAFTLSVTAPPQITSAASATFTAGVASGFAVTATGSPTPSVVQTGPLPAGITFNTVTHTLKGTPTEMGTFSAIQLTASNGIGVDAVQAFTLNVICPVITVTSTPPTVPNDVFNVPYAGATFQQTGGGTGGTWSSSGPLGGLTLDPSTGALTGTPTNTGIFNATITYTNAGNCQGSTNVSISVAANAVGDLYNAALGNTQVVAAGHSSPTTPVLTFTSSVLANDAGPAGTLAVTPVTNVATIAGGLITIDANGAFTYTPLAGDTGLDGYQYTLNSNGVTATASIVIDLGSRRVWYVNSGAAAGGTGTSNAPFNTLTNVNGTGGSGDVDDAADYIYVHAGTYGGFEAEANQTLWGSGAAFTPVINLAIAATTTPTLLGTVTIAGDDVTISSIAISAGPNIGITNTGTRSGLTIKNGVTVGTSTATAVQFNSLNSTDGGAPSFGINFERVDSNGSPTAISLTNVNTVSGSFTITGTGAAASGGIMQNALGNGISLSNTRNVRLDYVAIFDSASNGIFGTGVTNFSMHSSSIQRAGDAGGEHALNFGSLDTDNLLGTATITNSFIADMYQHGITVENVSGTLTMNVLDTLIQNNHPTEGGDGILFQAGGTGSTAATMTLNVGETTADGCVFENLNGDAIQANSEALSTVGSVLTLNVNGCTIDTVGGGSGAIAITGINDSINRGIFDIRNNVIQSVEIVGITVFAGDSSELSGVILNNTVQSVGEGILVLGDGGGSGTGSPEVQLAIRNNTLSGQTDIRALRVSSRDGIGGNVQVQLEGNSVAAPIDDEFGGGDGIVVRAEDGMNICLDVQDVAPLDTNNASAGTAEPGSGLVGYRVANDGSGTFALEGYAGGPVSALFSVQNHIGSVAEPGTIIPGACTTP